MNAYSASQEPLCTDFSMKSLAAAWIPYLVHFETDSYFC